MSPRRLLLKRKRRKLRTVKTSSGACKGKNREDILVCGSARRGGESISGGGTSQIDIVKEESFVSLIVK